MSLCDKQSTLQAGYFLVQISQIAFQGLQILIDRIREYKSTPSFIRKPSYNWLINRDVRKMFIQLIK